MSWRVLLIAVLLGLLLAAGCQRSDDTHPCPGGCRLGPGVSHPAW